jgi:hypothetical protein
MTMINGRRQPTEALLVEGYEDSSWSALQKNGEPQRKLQLITTVPMTLEEANRRIKLAGYAPEITISRVVNVPSIGRTADGEHPRHDYFQSPPPQLEDRRAQRVPSGAGSVKGPSGSPSAKRGSGSPK